MRKGDSMATENNVNNIVKPKRGRKPKVLNESADGCAPTPVKKQAKQKVVFDSFTVLNIGDPSTGASATEDVDNAILKLNVSECELLKACEDQSIFDVKGFSMDNNPDAYESRPVEFESFVNHSAFTSDVQPSKPKVVHLLKDFEQKNKNNEWPSNTQIACYWCCHKFTNAPFGIPVKYVDKKYHVYGCFCSLECAAAYNFASKENMDEIWEQYNLINQLSREIGHKSIIKPAQHRLALTMFGGYLSIEEFRNFCYTSRIININFPPMMTLTQQIEEFNETDLNIEYKYVPIDTERINKYKEKMKLKRNKPLIDSENTLDHIISYGV